MAIQFAVKLGAEVVVFSSTPTKEAEAKAFGASEYCLASEPEKLRKIDELTKGLGLEG